MLEAIESNNNSFGHAGAAACENDVEWVITLERSGGVDLPSSESFIVSCGVRTSVGLAMAKMC
jgi:hypothetical protein